MNIIDEKEILDREVPELFLFYSGAIVVIFGLLITVITIEPILIENNISLKYRIISMISFEFLLFILIYNLFMFLYRKYGWY